jgi:hypothetical protein
MRAAALQTGGVSLQVRRGAAHAIVVESGAGRSRLMEIQPDACPAMKRDSAPRDASSSPRRWPRSGESTPSALASADAAGGATGRTRSSRVPLHESARRSADRPVAIDGGLNKDGYRGRRSRYPSDVGAGRSPAPGLAAGPQIHWTAAHRSSIPNAPYLPRARTLRRPLLHITT